MTDRIKLGSKMRVIPLKESDRENNGVTFTIQELGFLKHACEIAAEVFEKDAKEFSAACPQMTSNPFTLQAVHVRQLAEKIESEI